MLEVLGEVLEPGRVVGETSDRRGYRLERELGEGGMGVVWAARDEASTTPVALKFLKTDRADDPKDRARFLREASLAMSVSHPNVAKVHAVHETENGVPFLVMEFLEGESLRTILRERSILPPQECAAIFGAILAGVGAAHARGIVHRDLKPENVFIDRAGAVKVLDFGVAKRLSLANDDATASASLTSTGAVVGTPRYMAPEQIYGASDLDARADVWALGIMLYEALTGERPTEGGGLGEILRRITLDPIPAIRVARPSLPKGVELVDRMLSKKREDRPSLDEVATMLRRIESPDAIETVSENDGIASTMRAKGGTLALAPPIDLSTERAPVTARMPVAPTKPAPPAPTSGALRRIVVGGGAIAVVGLVVTSVAIGARPFRSSNPPTTTVTDASAATDAGDLRIRQASLPDIGLDEAVARLRADGWTLRSQMMECDGDYRGCWRSRASLTRPSSGGEPLKLSVDLADVRLLQEQDELRRRARNGQSLLVEDPPRFLSVVVGPSTLETMYRDETERALNVVLHGSTRDAGASLPPTEFPNGPQGRLRNVTLDIALRRLKIDGWVVHRYERGIERDGEDARATALLYKQGKPLKLTLHEVSTTSALKAINDTYETGTALKAIIVKDPPRLLEVRVTLPETEVFDAKESQRILDVLSR